MSTNQQPARGMSSLRRAVIGVLGCSAASASVALLATQTAPKKAGTVWPLHSHNFVACWGMLAAWVFLGIALVFVLLWLALGDDEPETEP